MNRGILAGGCPIELDRFRDTEDGRLDEGCIGPPNFMGCIVDQAAIEAPHIEADKEVLRVQKRNCLPVSLTAKTKKADWISVSDSKAYRSPAAQIPVVTIIVGVVYLKVRKGYEDAITIWLCHNVLPHQKPNLRRHGQQLQLGIA